MTMMRKSLVAVLLAVALAACFFTFVPATVHANTSGDYEYTVSGGAAHITEYKGSDTTVDIPDSLGGYTVTGLDDSAFNNNTSIKNVTIPSSVTAIGTYAFALCTNLNTVTILGPVTELGDSVFYNCSSLKSVILHDSLTTLGPRTFQGCTSLASITIPDGVTSIGLAVFDRCTSLTSITLPEKLEEIGNYAFRECGFTSFEIPLGVTAIYSEAFYGCGNLTSLSIPDNVKRIDSKVVDDCSSFSDIYYWGSEYAWQELLNSPQGRGIDEDNAVLRNATIHYNSIPSDYHRVHFSCAIYLFNMPGDQTIKKGKTVNKPSDPSYYGVGCTFGGWYSDEACTTAYDFSSPVTADLTLYAKMLAQITFDANGHGTSPATQTVRCGDKIKIPVDPQVDGWKFDGWYTDADCTSKYDFNQVVTGPMTLYAKWNENTAIDISACTIDSISAKTYTGSAIKPDPKVIQDGKTLIRDIDYTLAYINNTNTGTAIVIITGIGDYYGTVIKTFTINKSANPLTMKPKTASVKYSKLKKKAQTLAVSKVIKFTKDAKDKKTYTLSSAKKGKKSFKKYFKIDKSTDKVTVKKGLKKGTYKVKVKVKAKGNSNYKASAVKTVTFKVRVK